MVESDKEKELRLANTVRLIGKRWNILKKLSKEKQYVNGLAKELEKSPSEICKFLKELEKNGLVESEQEPGRRIKYYYISNYAKKICTAITKVDQPKPKGSLKKWQIDQLLNIIEDEDLSNNLRLSFSETFRRICKEHYAEVANHERARRLFEKVATDPFHDKVSEDLMKSISAILPHALSSEKSRNWVLRSLYPVFVKEMRNEDEKIKVWAMDKVGSIAGLCGKPTLKKEVVGKFFKIWFSEETRQDNEIGKEVKGHLLGLASEELFEQVRSKAKDQNIGVKAKAEILLEELKGRLLSEPNDRQNSKVASKYQVNAAPLSSGNAN